MDDLFLLPARVSGLNKRRFVPASSPDDGMDCAQNPRHPFAPHAENRARPGIPGIVGRSFQEGLAAWLFDLHAARVGCASVLAPVGGCRLVVAGALRPKRHAVDVPEVWSLQPALQSADFLPSERAGSVLQPHRQLPQRPSPEPHGPPHSLFALAHPCRGGFPVCRCFEPPLGRQPQYLARFRFSQ